MDEQFRKVGIRIHWVDPVLSTDTRIPASEANPRPHAIMLNHLDMIKAFLESDAEYGIFCEDDIHIRRSFVNDLQIAIDAYKRLNMSVMLLGYLINYRVSNTQIHGSHNLLETPFVFTAVVADLWGSQMYMMNKQRAKECLDMFHDPSAVKTHYSPDWTITKMAGAACIYPMLAVESGIVQTDHWGQIQFHKSCFETNYNEREYF